MEASHPKYRPGQVWAYRARSVDQGSRATILRVDEAPGHGFIVHVALSGVAVKSPQNRGGVASQISHLPFSEAAVDDSMVELESTGPVPDFEEGYATWREGFDKHEAGIWSVSFAEAVAALESILNRTEH